MSKGSELVKPFWRGVIFAGLLAIWLEEIEESSRLGSFAHDLWDWMLFQESFWAKALGKFVDMTLLQTTLEFRSSRQ